MEGHVHCVREGIMLAEVLIVLLMILLGALAYVFVVAAERM